MNSGHLIITGATGHIGSRLIRDWSELFPSTRLVMVDNMSTQRYASLFNLPTGDFRFVEGCVREVNWPSLLDGARAVVHLAALTDAAGSINNAAEVKAVNLGGTECVARACALAGVPLLFPSSTSVYGTQEKEVDENCSAESLQPQSPYAETKLEEEALLGRLQSEVGLRFVVLRLGTIFGVSPGMRFHTAVNKFCWQAAYGRSLSVWRTAYEQQRPYLDLGDAVRAMGFVVERDLFNGDIFNVLTTNSTVREIVSMIQAVIPGTEISFVDNKIMNQLSYEVANRKFCDLGFEFKGRLEIGIQETLQWLRGGNAA